MCIRDRALLPHRQAQPGHPHRHHPGQPIHATLGGKVAFAGYMRGYGNLMILQHGPSYTSTYAYNSRLLVKEGQMVIKGQKIAEAGSQDTDRAQLYFEIRANGVPVDPLRLLPPG